MSILDQIFDNKRRELAKAKRNVPLTDLKARIDDMDPVRSFRSAIKRDNGGPVKLIAELKKASPSKGLIREDFKLPDIISVYDRKQVSAVSVLTEERYFAGSLKNLQETRKRTEKPLLRKDFIFDPYQVYEARANGADAVLLIAASLEKSQISDLYGLAKELSLDCLIEVHNLKELDATLDCGAEIVGINNRNLKTLEISLNMTFEMLKDIPEDRTVVSESGINSREHVESIEASRTDAILVGTAIMKSDDIGAKIDELMGIGTE